MRTTLNGPLITKISILRNVDKSAKASDCEDMNLDIVDELRDTYDPNLLLLWVINRMIGAEMVLLLWCYLEDKLKNAESMIIARA